MQLRWLTASILCVVWSCSDDAKYAEEPVTTMPAPEATGRDCISLVASVPNKPGAVHDMLVPLKVHGVSMTRFESRPARSGQWEYFFFIDLQGHPSQPNVAAALRDLQGLCAFYKILGTYPLAD